MVDIGALPGHNTSHAFGVSQDGSIVVGSSDSNAFIWDAGHGIRNLQDVLENEYGLDLGGWLLRGVFGISDDGTVLTGIGYDHRGYQRCWIATIPEPATLLLLGFGGLALLRGRRHG